MLSFIAPLMSGPRTTLPLPAVIVVAVAGGAMALRYLLAHPEHAWWFIGAGGVLLLLTALVEMAGGLSVLRASAADVLAHLSPAAAAGDGRRAMAASSLARQRGGSEIRTQVRIRAAEGMSPAAIAREASLSQDVVMMVSGAPHRPPTRAITMGDLERQDTVAARFAVPSAPTSATTQRAVTTRPPAPRTVSVVRPTTTGQPREISIVPRASESAAPAPAVASAASARPTVTAASGPTTTGAQGRRRTRGGTQQKAVTAGPSAARQPGASKSLAASAQKGGSAPASKRGRRAKESPAAVPEAADRVGAATGRRKRRDAASQTAARTAVPTT